MKVEGICHICREWKLLNYEHFPPRSAYNKQTRFFSLPSNEYYTNFTEYLNGKRPKVKLKQGGLGEYCLCVDCNNFLGLKYVNDYVNFAKIAYGIISSVNNFKAIEFKISHQEVNLKNFLKQITSIFLCNNNDWFAEAYPELLEFVRDEDYISLPEKYRFYMYLNDEGQIKNGNWTLDNVNGGICEFVFPPFGFVLNIENQNPILELSEITAFKYFDSSNFTEVSLILNKFPTYSPIPLDFREKENFIKKMSSLEIFLQKQINIKVIDSTIDYKNYVPFDLSAKHTDQLNLDLTDAKMFEEFVEDHLAKNSGKVAFGGYMEQRNLYKRSSTFNDKNTEERNIHIGLDLWIKAGTSVLSALDGKIHSFQNNTFLGDYGPTIIVEHLIDNITFYTLYGHLSLESLEGKTEGQLVKKGEKIAELGKPPINGDYAPHLHFQIIKNIQNKKGDYPGVCSSKELDFYKENCPDPNLLLKIV